MKQLLIFSIISIGFAIGTGSKTVAQTTPKKTTTTAKKALAKKTEKQTSVPEKNEIHWITDMNELQLKMQQNPKKVYMDVYTNWCGWCKKMDASTFQNPALIKYMNTNYYAVRFDAERTDTIHFMGKDYVYEPAYKANRLALELMKGSMSYPTGIYMMEGFQNPQVIPGYRTVSEMEGFLTYFGDNAYRHMGWPDYQKTYKPSWDHGETPNLAPAPGQGAVGH